MSMDSLDLCHSFTGRFSACPFCSPGALGCMLSLLLSTQFLCTVVAILLHYVSMGTFAWTLVENLHVYRMLTEVRNIDTGPMRFYHVVGWGIPAIVTGKDTRHSSARVACVKMQISPEPPVPFLLMWPSTFSCVWKRSYSRPEGRSISLVRRELQGQRAWGSSCGA